jgi:predicted O-methyltransferase YrrM
MADFEQRRIVQDRILELYRGDPFEEIIREAEIHRFSHGANCGLFPAGTHVMRFVATLARGMRPRRVLDLGTGFGYSAIWLASACDEQCLIEAIDLFPEHVARAERFASHFGYSDGIEFIVGEVSEVLERLAGPYDLIHDDAWFAAEPPYFERMIALLRPGGTLTMPNWFLLEDAITGEARRDWAGFAGPNWGASTMAYAERLAADSRLAVAWGVSPPLAVAVKLAESAA